CFNNFLGSVAKIICGQNGQARFCKNFLSKFDVRPFETDNQRHAEGDFLRRSDNALGNHIAAHDAAEDVDEDAFDILILQDDLEGLRDLLARGAAANVEEVCRLAAVQLDDIHRRHGETCAVHHAADIAIELDVAEIVLRRFPLGRILFVPIAQLGNILVPVKRVVIEVHLRIQRDHIAATGHDQRVDFNKARVCIDNGVVKRHDELDRGIDLLAFEAEAEGYPARMERHNAGRRINAYHEDFFRCLFGDFLDVHSAFGGGHEGHAILGAVDDRAKIEFTGDIAPFLDIDALDFLAFRTGLMRHELHADHGFCRIGYRVEGLDDLDAAALAATACMDLRLDDPDRATQPLRDAFCLIGRIGYSPSRYGHAVFREQAFRLIFMNIHRFPF